MMLISATLCQFMSEESPTSFTGAPLSISWAMALVSASRFASEASTTSCRTSLIFSRSRLAALCWDKPVCSVQEKIMDIANARTTIRSSQRRKVFEMVLFLMCFSFSFLIFPVSAHWDLYREQFLFSGLLSHSDIRIVLFSLAVDLFQFRDHFILRPYKTLEVAHQQF